MKLNEAQKKMLASADEHKDLIRDPQTAVITINDVKSEIIMEIIQADREALKRFTKLKKSFKIMFNKELNHVDWWWKQSERHRSKLHAKWAGRS